jgi:Tfp pilus assembly protein PilO
MDKPAFKNQLSYRSYITRVRHLYEKPVAQTSTALILTLVTIVFFGLAAIKPTLGTVSQLVGELEEKRKIEVEMDKKINTLMSLQNQYLTSKDLLLTFDLAVPSSLRLTEFITHIQYLAYSNSIALTNLRAGPLTTFSVATTKTSPANITSFSVNLTAESKYVQIQKFLDEISNLQRVADIESVSIKIPDIDETKVVPPDQYQFNAKVTTYYMSN